MFVASITTCYTQILPASSHTSFASEKVVQIFGGLCNKVRRVQYRCFLTTQNTLEITFKYNYFSDKKFKIHANNFVKTAM